MIAFFRTRDCPGYRAIQETLEQLSLAHKVVIVSGESKSSGTLPPNTRPPVLVDDGQVIQGIQAIIAHLEELEDSKARWEKFQSDACYCDDQGKIE